MDLTSVTAVLGSIKTATEIAKYIKDTDLSLEKAETKLKLADLIGALSDAKLEGVGVQQTLAEAEARIRELEQTLETRVKVRWEEPFYWLDDDSDGLTPDGPFCQHCYDGGGKLVRLQGYGDGYFECKVCKNSYVTKAHREHQSEAAAEFRRRRRSAY
jgi:hypothetical protein